MTTDPATPPPAPAPTPTPGWRTSEFWLSLLATLLSALYASGIVVANGTVDHAIALAAMVLAPLGYTVNRGQLKAAHAKAAVGIVTALALLVLMPTGCGGPSASTRLHAGGQAFSTCVKADLSQAVGSGSGGVTATSVLAAVWQVLVIGAANWQAELDAIATAVGTDTLTCALDAIEAIISPPATAVATPGKVGAPAPSDALLRLRAYRLHVAGAKVSAQLDSTSAVVDQALAAVGAEQHR